MDKEKIMKTLLSEKEQLNNLISRVLTEEIVESDSWRMVNELGDEALEGQELLSKQEKLDILHGLLRRVEQSMKDLNNDRYGICNLCEGKISEERLLAHPHVQYCLKCQKLVDSQEK